MKRFFSLLLVFLLIVPSVTLSDSPDLSSMSPDELLTLIRDAQLLLFSAELNAGVKVPQGTYIIGEDIPAGTYRIEITGIGGYYDHYDKKDGYKLATGLTGSTYDVSEIGKIILEEGNVLVIRNSTFIFFPYTGVFH